MTVYNVQYNKIVDQPFEKKPLQMDNTIWFYTIKCSAHIDWRNFCGQVGIIFISFFMCMCFDLKHFFFKAKFT